MSFLSNSPVRVKLWNDHNIGLVLASKTIFLKSNDSDIINSLKSGAVM